MGIALNNNAIDKLFGFIYKLDNATKKKLIGKLKESIREEKAESFNLKSLYGAWSDCRTSDEIISDIKNSRIEKQNLVDF